MRLGAGLPLTIPGSPARPVQGVPSSRCSSPSSRCSFAEANPFLQSVYRSMMSKLLQLPDKHSVTALLNTWAQSIRQACLSAA